MPPEIARSAPSSTAFVGRAPRGPADEPVRVASWEAFEETFGAAGGPEEEPQPRDAAEAALAAAVRGFFDNGGSGAIVVRVPQRDPGSSTEDGTDSGMHCGQAGGPTADFVGEERRSTGTGLYALDTAGGRADADVPDVDLLVIPPYLPPSEDGAFGDVDYEALLPEALAWCEARRALLVLDPPVSWRTVADVDPAHPALAHGSPDAALYFPRVRRDDGARGVPPSGAVAGVIARTDAARGPWKSPAGLDARLVGCEPEVSVGADASTMLNGYGVCALRTFTGSGPVVWGARTTAAGSAEWRYIAVRRTALAVLQDVGRGTAWAASEPNGPSLWEALREAVENYVHSLWRDGAFPGWAPDVSYFVRCGEDTARPEEHAAGTAVVLIGLAVQRAGEFTLLRVPVATADAAAGAPPAATVGA